MSTSSCPRYSTSDPLPTYGLERQQRVAQVPGIHTHLGDAEEAPGSCLHFQVTQLWVL